MIWPNLAHESRHDQMVALVEEMLSLHQQLQAAKTPHEKDSLQRQITATDRRIDTPVYELYGLTKEAVGIVEGCSPLIICPMPYEIVVHELAAEEVERLRVYDQRRIVAEIEEQLRHQPAIATRRRKCLAALTPAFEHVPPVWELRVGDFRIFYEVDADALIVHVRAVRRKQSRQRTEDIA